MRQLGGELIRETPFEAILMGNQAVVRAMVESGTRVVSSCPGFPVPEIAIAIQSIPKDQCPFYFECSVNEKQATEVALGAALNGNLSTAFYRDVGLNAALDTFVRLGLLNIPGGMVVVLGDDTDGNSSLKEQDNRNILRMARVAVLEPASPEEAYAYYKHAAVLAADHETLVVLRMTTHVCHARQKIRFSGFTPSSKYCRSFPGDTGPCIPLTDRPLEIKKNTMAKFHEILTAVTGMNLNRVIKGDISRGIITSGKIYLLVMDVLKTARSRPFVLKLGVTNPLEKEAIYDFLSAHDQILVLEELDDILENQIKALAYDRGVFPRILGKTCDEDYMGEFTLDRVFSKLRRTWPELMSESSQGVDLDLTRIDLPARICPGCGHGAALLAIKIALAANDVTVADIGCHTQGGIPPSEIWEDFMSMGAFSGVASGLSLENTEKNVMAFIGDPGFFNGGLPDLINTVLNQNNMTLIIMENQITAMAGDHDRGVIRIEELVKALGIDAVFSCHTPIQGNYGQEKLTCLVKTAMEIKGVSVVIAHHPSMLKPIRTWQCPLTWPGS